MIIPITDFSAPELDIYARLTENQLINRQNPDEGLFVCESPLVIERALDAGYIPVSILAEEKLINGRGSDIISRVGDIPIFSADIEVLIKLTGFHLTRGMLCAMRRPKLPTFDELCRNARKIAVLENIMNPTNLGAVFRSAAALDVDAVILTSEGCDPLYRRAIRVSMGTVFQVPWTYIDEDVTWTENGVEFLKSREYKTVALALRDDAVNIREFNTQPDAKIAIILGTEGTGLHDNTIQASDYCVKIPMSNGVDSLNVAAASAVAFYAIR